jgi:hypothetical protein
MKWFTFTGLLLMVSVFLMAQDANDWYASKSGKIKYQYEYAGMLTEYTIIFDDYGKRQVFDLVGKTGGLSDHSRTIITPESMYIVNYEEKQIIKFPLEADRESVDEFGGNSAGGIDLQEMVAEVKQGSSGKQGSEVVMGKLCDVYEYAEPMGEFKGKYWIWEGYLMRAEFIDASGEHTFMKVLEITIDTPVSAREFEVPSDFEVTDMTEMMEQMKQLQEMYGVPDEEEE